MFSLWVCCTTLSEVPEKRHCGVLCILLGKLVLQLGSRAKLKNYEIIFFVLMLFVCLQQTYLGCYVCHMLYNKCGGVCVCVCLFFEEKDMPSRPLRARAQSPDGRFSFRWRPPYGAGFRGPRSRSQIRGYGESSRRMSYAPLPQERQNQEARKLGKPDSHDTAWGRTVLGSYPIDLFCVFGFSCRIWQGCRQKAIFCNCLLLLCGHRSRYCSHQNDFLL